MAHFAKVENGTVTKVIVAEPEFFDTFVDDSPGQWIKTSYNMRGGVYYDPSTNEPAADQSVIAGDEARQRKNYAGIGYTYDAQRDAFIPPKPFNSWVLDEDTCLWDAPLEMPTLTQEEIDSNSFYSWDEDAHQADNTTGWVLITPES